MAKEKEILIIGDRLLVLPDTEDERTSSGLYLPQGVTEKEKVQTGYVVKTGPGYVVPHNEIPDDDWHGRRNEPTYIPLQVKKGDYAIFLRREAIEIEYEKKKYLIVPQSGVLAIVRERLLPPKI
ncbi:co-chaperone GroES [candidate division KSB1 bacterium]|nr:co-chaperone GroES [candidate division KSB1 bacterium]